MAAMKIHRLVGCPQTALTPKFPRPASQQIAAAEIYWLVSPPTAGRRLAGLWPLVVAPFCVRVGGKS
jgi:hypothetical protein